MSSKAKLMFGLALGLGALAAFVPPQRSVGLPVAPAAPANPPAPPPAPTPKPGRVYH